MPALAGPYDEMPVLPNSAVLDDTLTMLPPRWRIIAGITCRQNREGTVMCQKMPSSQSCRLTSSIGPPGLSMMALFTITSIRP